MNLHILSDPVTYFWKCPKKGFLKSDFWHFLNKMLVPHSATRLAAPVTLTPHRVEYGVIHPLTPSSWYCTVLYCNLLYYIVLYCTVFRAQRAPKSPPEELKVGGRRPPYLLVFYITTRTKTKWFKARGELIQSRWHGFTGIIDTNSQMYCLELGRCTLVGLILQTFFF